MSEAPLESAAPTAGRSEGFAALIERVLPSPAVGREAFAHREAVLFPQEARAIARAVAARRSEFMTVRACARDALAAVGLPPVPLVPGEAGAPVWPPGIVGSMTHCAGYAAAAVAHSRQIAGLGIDAEANLPLPEGVLDIVSLPEERRELAERYAGAVAWDRLLFAAKEAVYKVWFPLTGQWLDFEQAHVAFTEDGGVTARLLVPGPLVGHRPVDAFQGRWACERGLLVVGLHVPQAA